MLRRILGGLLVLMLVSLACNMPSAPAANVGGEVEATLAALRRTLPPPQLPDPVQVTLPTSEGSTRIWLETVEPGLPTMEQVGDAYRYVTRSGDTLAALALRFGVTPEAILKSVEHPPEAFLEPGKVVLIPKTSLLFEINQPVMPDSEVLYSPAAVNFSTAEWAEVYGGYLNVYTEVVDGETLTGPQIIDRVAVETSINPRLLLAFLEYRSHWLTSSSVAPGKIKQPIGFYASGYDGLHKEITLVARQLTIGYYGWRSGAVLQLEFPGGGTRRIDPSLNPGSVALQYLFSKLYNSEDWRVELVDPASFLVFYQSMFGDPWERSLMVGPVFSSELVQPVLELPFAVGERWSLTGGPHAAWGVGSAWGAVDFAPISAEPACAVSSWWVTASAPGLVVRSDHAMVVIDLDGDGYEATGWAMLYLHVAARDRVAAGTFVNVNDRIGHPSCEGGRSTGTHVHVARKYNGEWIAASGPLPMILSSWQVQASTKPYFGVMVRGDQVVTAKPDGSHVSVITR